MAFTQGRYQPGVLRGPQGRQAPLNGITMAGTGVKDRQLIAGPDRSGPVPGAVSEPRWPDVLAAAGQPERLRDLISSPDRVEFAGAGRSGIRLARMSPAPSSRLHQSNHFAVRHFAVRAVVALFAMACTLTVIISADRIQPVRAQARARVCRRASGALALPSINTTERR